MTAPSSASVHLRALAERREWLERRLTTGDGSPGSLGYATKELNALNWIILIAERVVLHERDLARDPTRQRIQQGWMTSCKWAARQLHDRDPAEWDDLVGTSHPVVAKALAEDMARCIADPRERTMRR